VNERKRAALREDVLGLVLAGGKSRRLGRDKAQLRFFGGSLLANAAALLSRLFKETLVVGRDTAPFGIDARWLPDDIPGQGPAGGILTALRHSGMPCLAVSCDLPFMNEETLSRLLAVRDARPEGTLMTTFRQEETGFVESLTAIYEPEGVQRLEEAIAQGIRKLSVIFPESVRCHAPYSVADPVRARAFFNVNFPTDLATAREMERVS